MATAQSEVCFFNLPSLSKPPKRIYPWTFVVVHRDRVRLFTVIGRKGNRLVVHNRGTKKRVLPPSRIRLAKDVLTVNEYLRPGRRFSTDFPTLQRAVARARQHPKLIQSELIDPVDDDLDFVGSSCF
jgi:hypothetical protein